MIKLSEPLFSTKLLQENEDVRIAVHEPYPLRAARQEEEFINEERCSEWLV